MQSKPKSQIQTSKVKVASMAIVLNWSKRGADNVLDEMRQDTPRKRLGGLWRSPSIYSGDLQGALVSPSKGLVESQVIACGLDLGNGD